MKVWIEGWKDSIDVTYHGMMWLHWSMNLSTGEIPILQRGKLF